MEDLHAKHASTELNRIFDEKFGAYMQQVNDGEAPMLSPLDESLWYCDEVLRHDPESTLVGYDQNGPMYLLTSYVDACRKADPELDAYLKQLVANMPASFRQQHANIQGPAAITTS
ncbi:MULTISPECIES: hypothetical protein [Aeromonas]|uniref:Uncharacterized protein n=1 Tax=Aeromonas veronii TaxID=654 RepID=A0A4V3Z027_AERVE|nr:MULTISPECIES: hypothetical protein [Aeromonas]THJ45042.1 hypothetical protein E8Q35_12720 [Aeromonas veronii]